MVDYTNLPPDMGVGSAAFGDEPSLLGAKFRQETMIGSIASSNYWAERLFPSDPTPIDPKEVEKRLQADNLTAYAQNFSSIKTAGTYNAVKADIQRELADKQVIADTGILGNLGGSLVVGLADPVNWIPIGQAFTAARAGATLAKVAGTGAATFGLLATGQEPAFQLTQQTRTLMDGFSHIAAATVVGGVVGTGAWAVNTPAFTKMLENAKTQVADYMFKPNYLQVQAQKQKDAYEAIVNEIANFPAGVKRVAQGPNLPPQGPVAPGATAPASPAGYTTRLPSVDQVARRDEAFDALKSSEDRLAMWRDDSMATTGPLEWSRTVGQRVMGKAFGSGWLDPSDYILKRTSTVEGKAALQNLVEVVQLLNKNVEKGIPTAQSATQGMDKFIGGWASFRDGMWSGKFTDAAKRLVGKDDSFFGQAKAAGYAGSTSDFERDVARAVVGGHVDPKGNPAVTAAAQSYKKNISDPIKELAEKAGYQVPDTPRFAAGHMPRQWIKSAVVGTDEGLNFRQIVADAYANDKKTQLLHAKGPGQALTAQEEAGAEAWARRTAAKTYDAITGVKKFEDGGFNPMNTETGNMLEGRVVPLADSFLIDQGLINYNITDIANYQARAVVPRLLIADKFKTKAGKPDPFMQSALDGIRKEYADLARGNTRNAVQSGARPDVPSDMQAILNEGNNVVDVLERLRDGFIHGPGFSFDGKWRDAEKFIHGVKLYEVTRLMGNLVINSLSDVSNILMRNGYANFAKGMVDDMQRNGFFNLKPGSMMDHAELMSEAKRWGAATEWATNASMSAHADVASPYTTGTFSNAMHNIGRGFSVANLSLWWNDFMRLKAFRAGMDRILETASVGFDQSPKHLQLSMNQLGLGKAELERIAAQWRTQSSPMNDGYLRFAHMSQWDDKEAVRLMADALAKDNASTVVRTRVGDFNSMAKNNPIVGLIAQFQNFIFSHSLRVLTLAEQRVIQEYGWGPDSARIYGGIAMHLGMGMLSAYLMDMTHDAAVGERPGKGFRTDERWQNPGKWLADGIDKSGALGMFGQANMIGERLKIPGISQALGAAMGDQSREVSAQKAHWMDRDPLQTVLGPALSQSADLAKLVVHATNRPFSDHETFTRGDVNTALSAAPFGNHFALRLGVFEPAKKWLDEDVLGIPYQR